MRQRSSHNWKSKPGTWDALNTELIDFDGDYPTIGTDRCVFDNIVNCNDYKHIGSTSLVSMFVDDYILERFWNHPHNYLIPFRVASCVMSPDFSLLIGMPTPLQQFQVYKNRLVGHCWQKMGINVIPTLSWSDSSSLPFAFSGISRGSVVAVSNVGVRNDEHNAFFRTGYDAMIKVIDPDKIIFMANKKYIDQYRSENVIFVDSFFNRRKKLWEEEVDKV